MIRRHALQFAIIFGLPLLLWGQDTTMADTTVLIGIKEAPPFVELREGYAPDGLSLEFWSEVEGEAQVLYDFKVFEDLEEIIIALEKGEIDMSINPITVTEERMEKIDFSQPFYISNTSMVRKDTSGWMGVFRNLFTWQFFQP